MFLRRHHKGQCSLLEEGRRLISLEKWKTYMVCELFLTYKAKRVPEVTYAIMGAEEQRLLAGMPTCYSGNSRSHQSSPMLGGFLVL